MKFEFTEQEINIIYGALQELPFKTVADVINTINVQYNNQQEMLQELIPEKDAGKSKENK